MSNDQYQFKVGKFKTSNHNPRATKACMACKSKKTRCFAMANANITSCSRCRSLGSVCSFEEDAVESGKFNSIEELRRYENNKDNLKNDNGGSVVAVDEWNKLNMIHEDVKKLVRFLTADRTSSIRDMPSSVLAQNSENYNSNTAYEAMNVNHNQKVVDKSLMPESKNEDAIEETKELIPSTMISTAFLTSPFNVLKESPKESLLPFSIQNLLVPPHHTVEKDIVTLRYITKAECYSLLNIFRDKYGKWISLKPQITTEELLYELCKESPLLLDVCCLVALRSSKNNTLKKKITKLLTQRISNSLSKQILSNTSTDLKFIATLTLLSVYGYTLSLPNNFNIDPWFYSGLALKHFITSINYNPSFINATLTFLPDASSQFDLLTYMRIYDHLLVTHLFNCIVSGRTCSIDRVRLNKIRSKLDIVFAGIFDGKMTAEVYLCDIVYDYFVNDMSSSVPGNDEAHSIVLGHYRKVIKKLEGWYDNWNYLIKQPIPQLLEFLYNFYSLLIYYHVNFQLHYEETSQRLLFPEDQFEDTDGAEFTGFFGRSLLNFETFSDVLGRTETDFLNKMIYNCLKVVNEIISFINKSNLDNIIDNSEQFEYISDQIHFSLFFSIVVLIRLINNSFVMKSKSGNTDRGSSELMKNSYIDYFNINFQVFDITGSLKHLILKSDMIIQNEPLSEISQEDFISYITCILIIVKKYQVVANDINIGGGVNLSRGHDTNNAFYRYFYTLKVILLKAFPGLNLEYLFE